VGGSSVNDVNRQLWLLWVDRTPKDACQSATWAGYGPNKEKNVTSCYNGDRVLEFILSFLPAIAVFFRSRTDLALELLALRQQVQTETASAQTERIRSVVLDRAPAVLASLEERSGLRQA